MAAFGQRKSKDFATALCCSVRHEPPRTFPSHIVAALLNIGRKTVT